MIFRIQIALTNRHESSIMIAKKSNVDHSLQIGSHCFGRPVWESFQFGPDKYMRPRAYLNEPIRFAGVGIVVALVTRINVVDLLLTDFENGLGKCK